MDPFFLDYSVLAISKIFLRHVILVIEQMREQMSILIVGEPVIGLINWLRPKGLKMCSYLEKIKNQTLKNIGWYTKVLCAMKYPLGMQYLKLALKFG